MVSYPILTAKTQYPMIARYILPMALLASVIAQGQEFISLTDLEGNVMNGGLLIVTGEPNEDVMEGDIIATLVEGPLRNINVRRYELAVQPVTQNYFCWGVCYAPQDAGALPVWNSAGQHSLPLTAGEPVSNFHGYHVPLGQVGTSTYRFVWFDTANPTDSVWADIQFQAITGASVRELEAAATISAFPNPSRGEDVQFQLDVRNVSQALDLVVFNAVGERVHTITVRSGQPIARLSTANLSEGLYFATLQQGGSTLAVRRFAVTGR